MKFLAGVVVGILVGRPVVKIVDDHLTPSIRRKFAQGARRASSYMDSLGDKIERVEDGLTDLINGLDDTREGAK